MFLKSHLKSIVQVRASRSLPLRLMAAEYEHILKRRLKRVGGSPDDPALTQLLEQFKCVCPSHLEGNPCTLQRVLAMWTPSAVHRQRSNTHTVHLDVFTHPNNTRVHDTCDRMAAWCPDATSEPATFLACREERLPSGMVRNGNVQKDSVLTFTRGVGGRITAVADGQELATVTSPAFAAAVFDLYLGDQPVSPAARATALDSASRMLRSGGDGYAPAAGLPGICESGAGSGACVRRWPWEHTFRPHPQPA